jgi:hypothetical protein
MTSLRLSAGRASVVSMLALAMFADRSCESEYPCRGREVEWEWVARGGWLSSDNRIHYTVRLDPDVPVHVRGAVDLAVQGWNKHLETSNIILDLAAADDITSKTDLFIIRRDNEALDGNCAKFHSGRLPSERKIARSPQAICYSISKYESWITSSRNHNDGAVVMAHELGHFLGLDDAASFAVGTIMAQGYPPCQDYAKNSKTRLPTSIDARSAGICISRHHSRFSPMKISTAGHTGLTTGLIFSLLSLSYAQGVTGHETVTVKPTSDWDLAREGMQLARMRIPDAAQYVKGEYILELAPSDELVAKNLVSLSKDSGLIVVARLREGESFLTKDGMSISTAYQADVSDVIKGQSNPATVKNVTLKNPWTIKIILPGGKIQLGSGKSAEVRIRDRKPVAKGETYVFFLQHVEQVWPASLIDHSVTSGYVPRLGWQGIFQLTGRGVKPRGREISPVPKEYANTPNKEFIQLIRNAVSN